MNLKKYMCIAIFFSFMTIVLPAFGADCTYNGGSIAGELANCLDDSDLVDPGDALIESGVKQQLLSWTNALGGLLGLLAVGAIVYGAFLMTVSGGDDEKIKKGKDIVKWSLIGFFALISAGSLLRLVTELIFAVAS